MRIEFFTEGDMQRAELFADLSKMEGSAARHVAICGLAFEDPRCEALQEEVAASRDTAQMMLAAVELCDAGMRDEDLGRAHAYVLGLMEKLSGQLAWMSVCGEAGFVADARILRS